MLQEASGQKRSYNMATTGTDCGKQEGWNGGESYTVAACSNKTCVVNDQQPPASAIPGNIGIINAKVVIWDHDPFKARPHQNIGFPFSNLVPDQLKKTSSRYYV